LDAVAAFYITELDSLAQPLEYKIVPEQAGHASGVQADDPYASPADDPEIVYQDPESLYQGQFGDQNRQPAGSAPTRSMRREDSSGMNSLSPPGRTMALPRLKDDGLHVYDNV
jgi:hypothetical protein